MKQEHIVPVQIRFNDIDLMGHVYNAKYQEFFDLASLKYFETVLGELISWTHKGLVIASVKVDYMQPTFLEDEIHVETSVSSLGEKSLEMKQAVYKHNSLDPVAVCKSVMVCFDMKARISEPIPEEWRKKFTNFEPELGIDQSVG